MANDQSKKPQGGEPRPVQEGVDTRRRMSKSFGDDQPIVKPFPMPIDPKSEEAQPVIFKETGQQKKDKGC